MDQLHWKPDGAPTLAPLLFSNDPDAALQFYQDAFGFDLAGPVLRDAAGAAVHAMLGLHGELICMVGMAGSSPSNVPPVESELRESLLLYVYVPDVDALYERATAAGAKVHLAPADMFWGDRITSLEDRDGHRWNFATRVKSFDPSQDLPEGFVIS